MKKIFRWRSSITVHFFAVICGIAVAFVGILTILNLFFYKQYYTYERKYVLANLYQEINQEFTGVTQELSDKLNQYENRTGVRISIVDANSTMLYDSIFREPREEHIQDKPYGSAFILEQIATGAILSEIDFKTLEEKGYVFVIANDVEQARNIRDMRDNLQDRHLEFLRPTNQFLCLIGKLSNNALLLERIPMAYMEQNSAFNRTFLTVASLFTLCICIILAYVLSHRFTSPLIQIEEIATAMADLDFSKKYLGSSDDEIGRLGRSINRLSKHLEEAIGALQHTNAELAHEITEKERIDSMRREFIINVSHELKTPLAVIQGYAEGLRLGVTTNEEDREYYCNTIVDESQRMNQLVMQLLNLSKLELGRETPEPTDVDLAAICQQLIANMTVLWEERHLQISCEAVTDLVYADTEMMAQVVSNYLSNAIRYTPDHGHITLATTRMPDGAVTFLVDNDGEPIPTDSLPLLFEQFYRTDKARSRESGGTGIGLSIVRAIAELHGGSCGAKNLAHGVRFWFTLPAYPIEQSC